jgi:hypothetical protein
MAQQNRLLDDEDRIRAKSSDEINRRIDQFTEDNIRYYATQPEFEITQRINLLEDEWDVDRLIQAWISGTGLTSIFLGTVWSKKWWILTAASLGFLGNHAVNGWCPSANVFRRLGYRTRQEIDREKYALKALRGDFDAISKLESGKIDARILSAIDAVKTI